LEPPAGNGTTKLMDLLGQSCAKAPWAASATPTAVASKILLSCLFDRAGMVHTIY
jgi:hypothetical protein